MFFFLLKISFGYAQSDELNVIKELQLNVKKITDDFQEFSTRVKENLKEHFEQEETHVPEQFKTLKNNILQDIEVNVFFLIKLNLLNNNSIPIL